MILTTALQVVVVDQHVRLLGQRILAELAVHVAAKLSTCNVVAFLGRAVASVASFLLLRRAALAAMLANHLH